MTPTGGPLAARAQRAMPVVGLLNGTTPTEWAPYVAAVRQGLSEQNYFEGRKLELVHLWAEGRYERLPAMAAELVRRQVAVIVTSGGGAVVTRVAKEATTTIPIVSEIRSASASSPRSIGLVAMSRV
jgi:hypothetical protein